jgi:imidazolonepropionase
MAGPLGAAAPVPAELLLDHATLLTLGPGEGPAAGAAQGELGLVPDGALALAGGRLLGVGPRAAVLRSFEPAEALDLGGRVVLPGLVDAHTHPVWAGSRAGELALRVAGASYLEIMAAGGGIASTVRATVEAPTEALVAATLARLDRLLAGGVTTVEAKTGYGLSTEEELRQLAVLAEVDRRHPARIVPTFLGAHALPDAYRGRADDYVALVVHEMLPRVAEACPGAYCDVFCDEGAFSVPQARAVLEAARSLGLGLKIHSDEFANLGATRLAAELGCASADHLVATRPEEMDALAAAGTVAVLLPGTTVGLGACRFAPAREMVARGVPVALGTDLNPGTCPCPDLPLILALAVRYLKLTPAEAIVAATRNAAQAVGRGAVAGRLAAGRPADLVVLGDDDYRVLGYALGSYPVEAVMVGGAWVTGALSATGRTPSAPGSPRWGPHPR